MSISQNPKTVKDSRLAAQLENVSEQFIGGTLSREAKKRALEELVKSVNDGDPNAAANTLTAFLDEGCDAATGLGFRVGVGGVLEESPSVRVAALDLLGRTGSPESRRYADRIMDSTQLADEYAVALRNLAWSGGDVTAARDRFTGMLDRNDWIAAPSGGLMEAFDVAVATGGSRMVREVGAVVMGEEEISAAGDAILNRPAFIALDRLMLRDPAAVIQTFKQDPDFLSWAPSQRASMDSRVDVRDPSQKSMLEDYLTKTTHANGEVECFANVYPNVNGFDGNRLVIDSDEIRNVTKIDTTTRETSRAWQKDPKF